MTTSKHNALAPLLLGLALVGLALVYEFLWMAKEPMGEGMAFAVTRLHLKAVLGPHSYETFALSSMLIAVAGVVASGWVAVRAVGSIGRDADHPPARWWRLPAAVLVLVVFAVPAYHVMNWADGCLYQKAVLDGAWSRRQFLKELSLGATPRLFWLGGAMAMGAALLVTTVRWPSQALGRLVAGCGRLPRWALVLACSACVMGLATAYSLFVLRGEPRYPDAGVYYFQAKVLASGRLTSPVAGHRDFFDPTRCAMPAGAPFAFVGGRFFGVGLPLTPVCYVVGLCIGLPWLVPVLLGGALVGGTYWLAREAFGALAAAVAALLAAVSPWLIFMSGEYLTHVPCALASVLFLAAALRAWRLGSWRWAAVAGLCLGLAAAARPVTAVGVCVPTAVTWAVWLVRRPRVAWRPVLALLAAFAVPMAGLLAYNAGTTGHPFTFGYQVAMAGWEAVPAEQMTPGWQWRLPLGAANVLQTFYHLSLGALAWPIPWLSAALAVLLLAGWHAMPRGGLGPLLLGLSILSATMAYGGWCHVVMGLGGPRYVFAVLPAALALGGGAVQVIYHRVVGAGIPRHRASAVLAGVMVLCAVYGVRAPLARQLAYLRHDAQGLHKSFRTIREGTQTPAIVFLSLPATGRGTAFLYLALGRNAPALDGPVIFARDLGSRNRELAQARPGRRCYRWEHEHGQLVPLADDGTAPPERPAVVFLPMGASAKDTARFYLVLGRNDPEMAGPLICARDLGPANVALAAALPGRHYYRWEHGERRLEPLGLGAPLGTTSTER